MSKADFLLHQLNTKTAVILKRIATKCGIASGGTKPILSQRIVQEIQVPLLRPLTSNKPYRILSIDMGIRNLAFCLLSIPPSSHPQIPVISDWNRLAVSEKPESSSPLVESFEPIDFAGKAYSLMKYSLDKYQPDIILIERQRYRSAGGAAIQEWTVRVNMLESMFHAVLHTLRAERGIGKHFDVFSVSPKRITGFWLADVDEKLNARETKLKKISVAKDIVKGSQVGMNVEIVGDAKKVAEALVGNTGGNASMKKMDDIADSMLQGLTWWKWHTNRLETVEEILSWQDVIAENVKMEHRSIKKRKL